MRVKSPLFACLLLAGLNVFAQTPEDDSPRIFGVVIDSVSHLGVPDVHITTNRYGTVSAGNGSFSLLLRSGDSIRFSHIGYVPLVFIYYAGIHRNVLRVALLPKTTLLREVKVLPFDTEEAFRSKLLEGDAAESHEAEAARENSRKLKGLGGYAPAAPITNFDRFDAQLKGPQGFTFFSSNPSHGIIKLIRGERKHEASYRAPKEKKSMPVKLKLIKRDSLGADSIKRDSINNKVPKPKPLD